MGALIGLLIGVGVLLIRRGLTSGPRTPGPHRRRARLSENLAQAGLSSVSPGQLISAQLAAGFVAFLLVYVVTGSLSVACAFAAFGGWFPRVLLNRIRHRRQSELREIWPEVVDNLISGVRAGLSLPEALSALGARGPETLRAQFRQFGTDYRVTGKFDECLDRLKANLADSVGDRVCESLRVAREVGGTDLGRLLSTLSGFLRDDARTRSELVARQSWSVNAARMAVGAPWLVLLMLATQRETLSAYDSATGTIILAVGGGISVVAYRLMIRIGRLPEDKRVLR